MCDALQNVAYFSVLRLLAVLINAISMSTLASVRPAFHKLDENDDNHFDFRYTAIIAQII